MIIRLRICMTNRTTEKGVIARCCMAIGTLIPFVFMLAAIDREILPVVVEISRIPRCFAVTILASRRETRRGVFGIGGLVIIADVASCTSVRGVVVIAVVAGIAIIGNGGVRPFQRVIIVVNGERGRLPGTCGVAGRAVRRNRQGDVLRVGGLVVIRCVTTRTIRRRSGITRSVATQTGGRNVCARQREICVIVVKPVGRTACRVTGQASRTVVSKTVDPIVLIGGFRVGMASGTREFRVVRRVRMAIRALIPLSFVLAAVNRKILAVVVKSSGRPGRFAVTGGAVR